MPQWVRLCLMSETPVEGTVTEKEVDGVAVCLAKVGGTLSAMENWCPHRRAPLGQGWIEGDSVVCPWHSWAFNLQSGKSIYPEDQKVDVFPLRMEGDDVMIDIE